MVVQGIRNALMLVQFRLGAPELWPDGGMADTADLKSALRERVRVQVPLGPPFLLGGFYASIDKRTANVYNRSTLWRR